MKPGGKICSARVILLYPLLIGFVYGQRSYFTTTKAIARAREKAQSVKYKHKSQNSSKNPVPGAICWGDGDRWIHRVCCIASLA